MIQKKKLTIKKPTKLSLKKDTPKEKKSSDYNCEKCGLYKKSRNPMVGYQGNPNHKLLFMDDSPNELVDGNIRNRFFKGSINDFLETVEIDEGIHDTLRGFAFQCHNSGFSSDVYAKCCRSKMIKMINELEPTCIISFGEITTNSLLNTPNKISIEKLRGRVIPSHEFNCVIMPTFNSKEFRYKVETTGRYEDNKTRIEAFRSDVSEYIKLYQKGGFNKRFEINNLLHRRNILKNKKIHQIKTIHEYIQLQAKLEKLGVFSFDYETTNTKPYDDNFEVISLCFAHMSEAWVIYLSDYVSNFSKPDDMTLTKHITLSLLNNSKLLKIIQNKQFEELCTRWWCKEIIGEYERDSLNQIIINYYDTMLATHVIDEREGATALDFQTLVRFGINSFYDENKMDKWIKIQNKEDKTNKIKECPKELLIEYTGRDGIEAYHNWRALKYYEKESDDYPWCIEFISKISDVFCNMSERGIPIDEKNLVKLSVKYENIQDTIQENISKDKDVLAFEKKRGKKLNIQSPKQIRDFFYNFLKLTPVKKTKGGKKGVKEYATDESVITHHSEVDNIPFCKMAIKKRKIKKGLDVLKGIKRFTNEDKKMHPSFWMNTTATVRSSSSDLNFQNIPIHGVIIEDEDWKISWKELRKVFVREGKEFIIAEVDFERNEVVGAANLSEDPQLIEDINTDFDMHSHWTNVIFGWDYDFSRYKDDEELQNYRYLTKNNWTFANFYKAGARSIAESFRKFQVYLDFLMKEYEQKKRFKPFDVWVIKRSEEHIGECQNYFYERYSTFKEWQDERIKFYNTNGYVDTPLGFRRHYPMQSTEIVNFPIQSTSYHILADACIRIEERMIREKRRSSLRAQIHDSLWLMIWLEEILDIIDLVNYEMINHNLPNVSKLAKLGTDWSVGVDWEKMRKIPSLL